jgi:hypothetical protein
MAKIQKVNRISFIALGFILVSSFISAQNLGTKYFSFGAIPFNRTVNWVESTFPADSIEYKRNPEALFLAFDAITRDGENPQIRELFKGAIRATGGWGSTFVMFYDRLVRRIDLNFPNEPNVNLFFVSPDTEDSEQRLFLVHKAMKTEGRFTEAFDQIKDRVTGLLGVNPEAADTRHRGQQFGTYARIGMWRQPEQIVLVMVREVNLQAKVSFVHYLYIDAGLWREYKRLVRQIEGSGQEDSDRRDSGAIDAF